MRYLSSLFGKAKNWTMRASRAIDAKYKQQLGVNIRDTTADKLVNYMYMPKDSSSLAVTRILFGLAMLLDIPDERGGSNMEKRWGDPLTCHFPLLPFVRAIPLPYMALVYFVLWISALGLTLGYKYRWSCALFVICYWYLLLIEKSYWNNHSYLFGLVSFLLMFTEANCYWSVDAYKDPSKRKETVPYWNYFILKYQFFILYFMAGMKKCSSEWLTGYSVLNLSEHWVFTPFKLFLTVPQIDYFIVHWFVFAFDLTVAIWMMWSQSRHIAMLFCALFHLMNSIMFRIGMFPWVCLATLPLFYPFDWPKSFITKILKYTTNKQSDAKLLQICEDSKLKDTFQNESNENASDTTEEIKTPDDEEYDEKQTDQIACGQTDKTGDQTDQRHEEVSNYDKNNNIVIDNITKNDNKSRKNTTCFLLLMYVLSQAFLPYSHFITQGYNNWTNGLYGYSWDMMVHTWDTYSVIVKITDNTNNENFYIDPYFYTPNDRWTRHGDMVHQYAKCLKDQIVKQHKMKQFAKRPSDNISIYIDVWCSMNGRFTQRMFNPNEDLLKVSWAPFQPTSYLMPLLDEALHWRSKLCNMKDEIYSQNNKSDVIFFADFPGFENEKYIPNELANASLTVLEGSLALVPEVQTMSKGHSYILSRGDRRTLHSGAFHKIINIGTQPVFYMYTFTNCSINDTRNILPKPILPIAKELSGRLVNMLIFFNNMLSNLFKIFFQRSC